MTYGSTSTPGLIHFAIQFEKALPRDRRLHGVVHHAAFDCVLAQVGPAYEFVVPVAGRTRALGILLVQRQFIPRPAVVGAQLERTLRDARDCGISSVPAARKPLLLRWSVSFLFRPAE